MAWVIVGITFAVGIAVVGGYGLITGDMTGEKLAPISRQGNPLYPLGGPAPAAQQEDPLNKFVNDTSTNITKATRDFNQTATKLLPPGSNPPPPPRLFY